MQYLQYILKIICLNDNNLYVTTTDEYVYHIANCSIHRIIAHILLTVSEMVIFKILYMYKFSIIVAMDEYFFTNFVTLLNGVINVGLTTIRFSLGEHRRTRLYLHNFAKPNEFYNKLTWSWVQFWVTLKDKSDLHLLFKFQKRQYSFCHMHAHYIDWLCCNNHQKTYFKADYSKNSKIKYLRKT